MDNIFKRWRGVINEMLYFSPEDEEKHALELKFGIQIPDIDFHFEDYPDKQSKDKILNSGTFYVPYKKIYLGFEVETPLANLVDVLPRKFLIIYWRQHAAPRIENLNGITTCFYFFFQI
jgi:hypothetical protein